MPRYQKPSDEIADLLPNHVPMHKEKLGKKCSRRVDEMGRAYDSEELLYHIIDDAWMTKYGMSYEAWLKNPKYAGKKEAA